MSDKKRKPASGPKENPKKPRTQSTFMERLIAQMDEHKRFSGILKAPLFVDPDLIEVPGNGKISFVCDACKKHNIKPVIRSYIDPDHDLCLQCYTRMRREELEPDVIKKAEDKWEHTIRVMTAMAALSAPNK